MKNSVKPGSVYIPSENVVAREVQGEFVIIPISAGVSDAEDEIFSLNETGKAIWDKLDGKRTLKDVAASLLSEFQGQPAEIEKDVFGLAQELFKRKMLICVDRSSKK